MSLSPESGDGFNTTTGTQVLRVGTREGIMTSKQEATTYLGDLAKKSTVHGIIRSVAPSGMSRTISFVVADTHEGKPYVRNITHLVATVLDFKIINVNGLNAIRVHGVGMDMIFSVVYNLGSALHGDGYYFKSAQL